MLRPGCIAIYTGRLAARCKAFWCSFFARVNLLLLDDIQLPRYGFSFAIYGAAGLFFFFTDAEKIQHLFCSNKTGGQEIAKVNATPDSQPPTTTGGAGEWKAQE